MADTLESLEIQVKHSSAGAAQDIKDLTAAINGLKDALSGITSATRGAKAAADKAAQGVRNVGKAAQKTQKPLGNFLNSLKRIAMYRMLRSIIRGITDAFSEGLEWAYNFSKGLADTENSSGRFAAAMDRMKSATSAMKAQLGSAFIGLLTALEPVLIRLINLINAAADAISQFFAAFTGTTYIKAVGGVVSAFESGAKAAKEWKNQLMGFDEINRLNDQSSGGSGGGALSGITGQDTELAPWAQWIHDNMESILTLAEGIGVAIAGWKLGNFISSLLKVKLPMNTIIGLAVAIGGAFVFIKAACDAWENGVNWGNLTLMIAGVAAVALGLGIAFGVVTAAVALLVGGFIMLIIAIRDWIKKGQLTEQTFWLIEAAIIAVGIALALLIGWPALLLAGFVAALGTIIYYWDQICAAVNRARDAVREFFGLSTTNTKPLGETGHKSTTGKFATGGFPEDGLFFANHNELVGQFSNGRTAVANNAQIVDGIEGGVFRAMSAALGSASHSNSGEVVLNIDGREFMRAIYNDYKAVAHERGVSLVVGG